MLWFGTAREHHAPASCPQPRHASPKCSTESHTRSLIGLSIDRETHKIVSLRNNQKARTIAMTQAERNWKLTLREMNVLIGPLCTVMPVPMTSMTRPSSTSSCWGRHAIAMNSTLKMTSPLVSWMTPSSILSLSSLPWLSQKKVKLVRTNHAVLLSFGQQLMQLIWL